MYSLIVGSTSDGVMYGSRMLEGIESSLLAYFKPNGGEIDPERLTGIPAIVTPEFSIGDEKQPITVGTIRRVSKTADAGDYRFEIEPYPGLGNLSTDDLAAVFDTLGVGVSLTPSQQKGYFRHTCWRVIDKVDPVLVLLSRVKSLVKPSAFNLWQGPVQNDLVALMMPFDSSFDSVQEALKKAANGLGLRCKRADDIYDNRSIIQDVVDLIGQARVVICDLTGKNANVFYEAGISHATGKEVILITHSEGDVPFDIRHRRYITYQQNAEGYQKLEDDVKNTLKTVLAR